MLNYTGTGRIDYEEVLREIGYFIDRNNIKEICLIELKEGLLLRGIAYTADSGGYHTLSESYLFTNEDLERIVEEGFKRRGGHPDQQAPAAPGSPNPQPGNPGMPGR
jgi:hypothetical protein